MHLFLVWTLTLRRSVHNTVVKVKHIIITYFVGGEYLDSFSSVQELDPISEEVLLLPERLLFTFSGLPSDPGKPNRSSVVRSTLLKRSKVLLVWSIILINEFDCLFLVKRMKCGSCEKWFVNYE